MKKYLWWGLAFFLLGVFVAVGGTRCFAEDEMTYPGVRSDWNGFDCYDFTFADRAAKLVVPKTVAPGSPWMWRARFFGHEPQTDIALLNHGFYVAYIDSAPLLGSPKSVELWQNFYLYLTETFHLSKKASLEG
ncbi:MAG: hypothetical protein IKW74_04290, partial [Thermoguttaceae bacterium]|nr:hypothetical protein [Thermoguttaceae bacterium]